MMVEISQSRREGTGMGRRQMNKRWALTVLTEWDEREVCVLRVGRLWPKPSVKAMTVFLA